MNRWRTFLLGIAFVFVISYGAIYAFATSPAYCSHSTNIADVAPCYKYSVSGVDADVLLVGDSALLYSISPAAVAAAGGPSTYNYGMIGPAFALDPAAVIDRYLAANRKPRAIVIYFSPWDRIEPGRITDPRWFPAATLVLQHGGPSELVKLIGARPTALAEIPPTVMRSVSTDEAASLAWRLAMEADGGHLDFATLNEGGTQSLEGRCAPSTAPPPKVEVPPRMRESLSELRFRYARQGIKVLIYVAPSATCDRAIGTIRTVYAGLADNIPMALPDRYFTADSSRQHTHVTSAGSVASSILLARFLNTHLPELVAR